MGIVSTTTDNPNLPKLTNRQGGSASDWATAGTTNNSTLGVNIRAEAGRIAVTANPTNVTFGATFASTPIILAQVTTASGANVLTIVTTKSTTGFSLRTLTDAGAVATTETVDWYAVGPV